MKWLGPAVVVAIAVLAEVTVGRAAGGPDAAFFFGRFHPLVVHLPIGFFLLVAAGEAATFHPKLRARVEPALGLLLPLSVAAALAAFLMGQLLALEGGFPAQSLTWHRRLTLLAVIGMAACWLAFARQQARGDGQGRWVYRGALGATLGLLSLGAHFGGTMTRGEAYLSKYAPGPLKRLLGGSAPEQPKRERALVPAPVAEPLVFQHVVQPILDEHCVECHGGEKQKGKLRLDSLEGLMKGGESGAVLVAGAAAKSSLLQRMLLPLSDDDRMPPDGKPSPKPEELALIEFWLERGASPALKVKDVLAPSASRGLLERMAGGTPPASKLPGAAAAPASTAVGTATSAASAETAVEKAAPVGPAEPTSEKPSAEPSATDAAPMVPPPAAVKAATGAGVSGAAFLATYCVKCHGPTKVKGRLRVDSTAALLKGGAEGPALVPGSPEKSSIVTRVRLPLQSDEHMPPPKESQPSATEIAAFVAWVRAGGGASATASAPARPASTSAPQPSPHATANSATTAIAETGPTTAAQVSKPATPAPAPAVAPAAQPAASGPPDPALLESLPPRVVLFADAIKPLLAEKCGKCHIKDKPAGGLDVAKHAAILEGGYSGPGVVAKDRQGSLLFARIILPVADDERMPPEGAPQLSADEIELVGAWIDLGAPAGGVSEVASLSAGAVRALSAMGVKAAPEPLAAQSGGCAACSVPGGQRSDWLPLQVLALAAAGMLSGWRRAHRRRA